MLSPYWQPQTEAELDGARLQGLLGERHHLEIKRELGPGRAAHREAAADLASFAIDGGLIIYGLDEDEDPPRLHPISLGGFAERIEQIGRSLVDEPLAVRSVSIPSESTPDHGYLVVTISPSPLAPHMVGGKYYGRNDKTKYVLSDDEVFRLHQRRQAWEASALDMLATQVDRDPTPRTGREGRLFVSVIRSLADPNCSSI